MGTISLEGMEFFAYHGCFAEERIIGTKFIVDLFIDTDTHLAETSDELRLTINYQTLYQLIETEMKIKSHLLENVAHRILKSITQQYPQIVHARVKVSKLNPPLGNKIDRVSVTISFTR